MWFLSQLPINSRPMPSTSSSTRIRVRQKVGKYRIERRIGEGGFATVYQAMDTIMGCRVAIKIPNEPTTDFLLATFRKEARMLSRLNHRGILQIKDASVIGDRLVISFPLGKETLSDRMTRRMSFETVMSFSNQLLEAVAVAHDQRVIHCDIKPENVILFDGQVTKLADFGIAKVANHSLRGCGTGTLGYMAPEQAMGRPSSRSDVFSLGLIIYRMLTGSWPEWPYEWPFAGHRKLKGKVHPDMIEWLRKATAVNPKHRFHNAVQMHNAFERIKPAAVRYIKNQRARQKRRKQETSRAQGPTRRAA